MMEKCTQDHPCDDGQPSKWCHTFEVVYEGTYFDTLQCPVCGYEVNAQPKERISTKETQEETP